jgi:hypothetical protein
MSRENYYWPGPNDLGVYDLVHDSGAVWRGAMWTGQKWVTKGPSGDAIESLQARAWGYLGVLKPPVITPDPTSDVAPFPIATAQQALDRWRAIQCKPAEVNHFAYEWIPELCRKLGAK